MGFDKNTRAITAPGYRISPSAIQTITLSGVSTAQVGTPVAAKTAVALINSTGTGAGHEVALAPRKVGSSVTVCANINSTVPITILLESTVQNLFGSTANAVTFSTNSSGTPVTLMKVSTSQYALLGWASLSTSARPVIAGSTGTV